MHKLTLEFATIYGVTWVGEKLLKYGELAEYLRHAAKAVKHHKIILKLVIKDQLGNVLGTFERG